MDEIGTVALQRICNEDTGDLDLRIASAAPRIRIAIEFLDDHRREPILDPHFTLDGDVLTIRDDYGQRFIYRIRWDDYADGGYLAEWPD